MFVCLFFIKEISKDKLLKSITIHKRITLFEKIFN